MGAQAVVDESAATRRRVELGRRAGGSLDHRVVSRRQIAPMSYWLEGAETHVLTSHVDGAPVWWVSASELMKSGRFRTPIQNAGPFPTAKAAADFVNNQRKPKVRK